MAGYWHPDHSEVVEVHNTRRESYSEFGDSNLQATLDVPIANLIQFLEDLLRDRAGILTTAGIFLYPQRIEAMHGAGSYTTNAEEDVIVPADYVRVVISYASDPRIWVSLFGQQVLVVEKPATATELLTQDYQQFAWQTTPTESLTSPDMAPSRIVRSLKVEMSIDRIDISQASGTAPGALTPLEVLKLISSTCNDDSNNELSFWTLPTFTFGPEQIMAEVIDISRTTEIWNGASYDQWWSVKLAFTIRPSGWNKFWRYKKSGTADASGWESIIHIMTATNSSQPVIESIYPPEPYIAYFLNPS